MCQGAVVIIRERCASFVSAYMVLDIPPGTTNMNLETRITHNPLQCGGKPCIRGMRIRVSDILQMLGEGVNNEEILQDFPDLELQDIQACLLYAARRANLERLAA
jgi:uncharacterized protein (DUF433 family)